MNKFSNKHLVTALGLSIVALLPNCGGCCKKEQPAPQAEVVEAVEATETEKAIDAQGSVVMPEGAEAAADKTAEEMNDKAC